MGEEEEEKVVVMVMVEEEVQGTEVVMKDRVGVGVGTEADDSCVDTWWPRPRPRRGVAHVSILSIAAAQEPAMTVES